MRGKEMGKWEGNLTHNFMQHTRVLGCSQFTRCIPLSKRKAKIKKKDQAGLSVFRKRFLICVLQVYFTSKSWRQIWWCVNQYFKYIFHHTIWGKQCYACVLVFDHTDLEQNLFFLALFKPIILHFFTILRDKLRSFPWISRTIEARASFEQKIIELTTL